MAALMRPGFKVKAVCFDVDGLKEGDRGEVKTFEKNGRVDVYFYRIDKTLDMKCYWLRADRTVEYRKRTYY